MILKDVAALNSELPNVYKNYPVPFDQWNHLDFIYGIEAYCLLFDELQINMAAAQAEFYPIENSSVDPNVQDVQCPERMMQK